jgi:hypothetical protein
VSSFELQPNPEEEANPFPCRKLYVPAFSPKGLLPALGEDLPFEEFSIIQYAHQEIIPKFFTLVKFVLRDFCLKKRRKNHPKNIIAHQLESGVSRKDLAG